MDIIKEVRDFVENECKKPESKYGYDPFVFHFTPMVGFAEKLADKLGGDKEVILVSAWLHDIGSIIFGRKEHHKTGAEIAEKKLRELGYPENKIELVKKCILHHRGSQSFERESIEEQIIAEADSLANFDNIPGIIKAAVLYENKNQEEAKEAVRKKLQNKWDSLHFEESKEMVRAKFEAAMLLFG